MPGWRWPWSRQPRPVVITDIQGTILYANPAFEKTTGYTCTEALGQNPRLLKSGKHDAGFYQRMWETLERGEIWSGHFINHRKDGALYEEDATISPVRDAAGTVVNYVAVKRDVTREMQLEANSSQAKRWNPSANSPAAWRTISTTFWPPSKCRRSAERRRRSFRQTIGVG